ncbi:MAG: hypothetical protein A3H31_00540 [Gallionellales bacterium RIFCSPLOWO2_02_FULL_57_47]|nr:MAG: hypothetical protein A3H31_00540 [Gallionellales bacterium RIFCSPLOWO2_02_FULL_57_47]
MVKISRTNKPKGFAGQDKLPVCYGLLTMDMNEGTLHARLVWTAATDAHIIHECQQRKKANMKQSMAIPVLRLTCLTWKLIGKTFGLTFGLAFGLTLAAAGMAAEPPAPPVKVGVYAKHAGNKIVYYYRVVNKSPQDITAVAIGYDTGNDEYPGNDAWELTELPSGWNIKFGIPSTSSNSPTGWRVGITTPGEESKTHAINWEIINDKSPVLAAGQSLARMSIALDKADINYLIGHALVTFSDGSAAAGTKGSPVYLTVPIEPLDTSPPTLTVTLTPNTIWSEDNKYIPVNVTFATKEDDYDNLPEIKLESITANEPLEPDDILDASYGLDDRYLRLRSGHNDSADRIYTVTYSATDASGNQSFASATVTVPATAPAPQDQDETGKIEVK